MNYLGNMFLRSNLTSFLFFSPFFFFLPHPGPGLSPQPVSAPLLSGYVTRQPKVFPFPFTERRRCKPSSLGDKPALLSLALSKFQDYLEKFFSSNLRLNFNQTQDFFNTKICYFDNMKEEQSSLLLKSSSLFPPPQGLCFPLKLKDIVFISVTKFGILFCFRSEAIIWDSRVQGRCINP